MTRTHAATFDHLYDDLFTHVRGLTRGAPGVALGPTSHHQAAWYGNRHPRHPQREAQQLAIAAHHGYATRPVWDLVSPFAADFNVDGIHWPAPAHAAVGAAVADLLLPQLAGDAPLPASPGSRRLAGPEHGRTTRAGRATCPLTSPCRPALIAGPPSMEVVAMTPSTSPPGGQRPSSTSSVLATPAAEAVVARREALHAAADALGRELAALEAQVGVDTKRLGAALQAMWVALRDHSEGAEASDGALTEIIATAPWLSGRAAHQRDEHHRLLADASGLVDRLAAGEDPRAVMDDARRLLHGVDGHRHRATTLLQDAYMADIPAGD